LNTNGAGSLIWHVSPTEANRLSDYLVYCFLGLAETDDQKVFLWPRWEQCFSILDELFNPFATTSYIQSSQAFVVPLASQKRDAPETHRVALKKIPLGRLKWSREDNRKWSQRPLQQAEYPIQFLHTQILSSYSKTAPAEIQVYVKNYGSAPGCKYNQLLTLTVCESIQQAKEPEYWANLADRLAPLVRAVRIGRTQRAWLLERRDGPVLRASSLAGATFTTRYDSLELDRTWQDWHYVL
jgi:hypothetical protein